MKKTKNFGDYVILFIVIVKIMTIVVLAISNIMLQLKVLMLILNGIVLFFELLFMLVVYVFKPNDK